MHRAVPVGETDRVPQRSNPLLNRHAVAQHASDLHISVTTDYGHRAQSQRLNQPLQGDTAYIQPPREHIEAHVLEYCHAKTCDSTLAALLLIPVNSCNQYTETFQLLQTYPPDHHDWVTNPDEAYNLWYDPTGHNQKLLDQILLTLSNIPNAISPTKVERLNMLFHAQVAGQPCIALLDTGATNNFITQKQVEQAGLNIVHDTSTV